MGHEYIDIAFTPAVKAVQQQMGSRDNYAAWEGAEQTNHLLGEAERQFIAARDSFYMATVSATGWPYLQHRGGPRGFMRVLDEPTLGFADFSGNRQYISTGNLLGNNRASLFFMDYPNRTRLKLYGYASVVSLDQTATLAKLESSYYRARVERGFQIRVAGFDWNCRQHITPRYSEAELTSNPFSQG